MILPTDTNTISINGVEFVKTDRTYGSYTSYDESVTYTNGKTSVKLTFCPCTASSALTTVYIRFMREGRLVYEHRNHIVDGTDTESLVQDAYIDMLGVCYDMYEIVKSLGD